MSNSELLCLSERIRPKLTVEDVKILTKKLYGFNCISVFQLDGYDDKNYKVTVETTDSDNDSEYVVKVLNSFDSKKTNFIEAQNELLVYLCNNSISCPNPIVNLDGECYSLEILESGKHIVRLLKYIPGELLCNIPDVPTKLICEIGNFVATLDQVLQKFNHPSYATYKGLWMLDSILHLKKFIPLIDNEDRKKMLNDIMDEFEEQVLTKIDHLEKGVIHGDVNPQNILLEKIGDEWKIKSILDFGDSQYSCYLFELAITMTYVIILKKDLNAAGYIIRGYSKIRKIPKLELDLLKICVEARLCQSLIMSAYSNKQDPENAYALITSKPGWELLQKMRAMRKDDLLDVWKIRS